MKIQAKLFILLTGFSCLLLLSFVVFTRWSINKGMLEFAHQRELVVVADLQQQLSEIYLSNNSWQPLVESPNKFRNLIRSQYRRHRLTTLNSEEQTDKNKSIHVISHSVSHLKGVRYALLDTNKELLVGKKAHKQYDDYVPITSEQNILGYLAITKPNHLNAGLKLELDFIRQQHKYIWAFSIIAIALIAAFSIPLTRHLVTPINRLVKGVHALTQGDYSQQEFKPRKDELGQLQQDHNNLARTLQVNKATQTQWLANTSHELRTPLAVIKGEIEAMLDGVRPLDHNNLHSIIDEVQHLERLITDLQQLSSSGMGSLHMNREPVDIASALKDKLSMMSGYLTKHNINLECRFEPSPVNIDLDLTRFGQLIENIIQNAVKYAGDMCTVQISLTKASSDALITIEDSGEGVNDDDLPHLFEYLYRVENSRNRTSGGFGLGLAICKQIVDAHNGHIIAKHSELGGLAIEILLPCKND